MTFDVAVVGGGPAGFGAAAAASRLGASVLLLEGHDVLGGMGTAALVNNFAPAHWDGDRFVIGGVFQEVRASLVDAGAIYARENARPVTPAAARGAFDPSVMRFEPYDPAVYAGVLLETLRRSGAEVRLSTHVAEASFGSAPQGVTLDLSDGERVRAMALVDATGDAKVAAGAGVGWKLGRAGDHAVMPLTFCFVIGEIDLERAGAAFPEALYIDSSSGERYFYFNGYHETVDAWIKQARASGSLDIPRDHVSMITSIPGKPTRCTVNYGRVMIEDPTDPGQLRKADEAGRGQIRSAVEFFREYVPGFERVEIMEIARTIGVRESRHIVGQYELSRQDVVGLRQFDDVIAQCCYPIDIHEPGTDTTVLIDLPRGNHYDIPWRCLVPSDGPDGLVVAGRAISASHEAMSSFRVSPSVMAIGEAAGVGAALAVARGERIRDVPYPAIRDRLIDLGAILT